MLNRAQMKAASQSFKLTYVKTMQKGPVPEEVQLCEQLMKMMPQSQWKQYLRWFTELPLMRHWVGDRKAKELSAKGTELTLKPWESTLKALRDDVMFDELGGYKDAIKQMVIEIKLLPWRRLIALIEDARSGTVFGNCFDGEALISASHPTGSNSGTAALTAAALDAADLAMRQQVDANGDGLLIRPTHIWYHPDLESTVESILDLDLIANVGTSTTHTDTTVRNRQYKKYAKLPLEGLGSGFAAYWGLVSLKPTQMLKPVIWVYKPGSDDFVMLDKDDDEPNFMRRELLFGTEYWAEAFPGFPQYIWGSDGTT